MNVMYWQTFAMHVVQETAYLNDAESYYTRFMDGNSSIAAVNNWDNQFYATSLLLWQLTESMYEDKLEVRIICLEGVMLRQKFGLPCVHYHAVRVFS